MLSLLETDPIRIPSSAPEIKIHAAVNIALAPPPPIRPKPNEELYKDYFEDQSFKEILSRALKDEFRIYLDNRYNVTVVVSRGVILSPGSIYADTIYSVQLPYSTSALAGKLREDIPVLEDALSRIVKFSLGSLEDFTVESQIKVAPPPFRWALPLSRTLGALSLILAALSLAWLLGAGGNWCQDCNPVTTPARLAPGSDYAKSPGSDYPKSQPQPCQDCEPHACDSGARYDERTPPPCY